MTEEIAVTKKRKIIERFLAELTKQDPQLYYATTAEVARGIHTLIKEHTNRLEVEEQALVRNITVRDIEVILGFH